MAANILSTEAPSDQTVVEYDRRHLLTYAELLDAANAGVDWRDGAATILGIDPALSPQAARLCWDSHLERARWIVGAGLSAAIEAFGEMPVSLDCNP